MHLHEAIRLLLTKKLFHTWLCPVTSPSAGFSPRHHKWTRTPSLEQRLYVVLIVVSLVGAKYFYQFCQVIFSKSWSKVIFNVKRVSSPFASQRSKQSHYTLRRVGNVSWNGLKSPQPHCLTSWWVATAGRPRFSINRTCKKCFLCRGFEDVLGSELK